ncbi:hypothetical protein A3Q56_00554 [Intoshia linei]|uniref:Uncharacterized protein n=1 Tax=Intoshia linei TaxID=1819745 RepID=A0A177BBF8_9BILA|nr:hypothetical protein A3Q56_00554 [Intoshia linei]
MFPGMYSKGFTQYNPYWLDENVDMYFNTTLPKTTKTEFNRKFGNAIIHTLGTCFITMFIEALQHCFDRNLYLLQAIKLFNVIMECSVMYHVYYFQNANLDKILNSKTDILYYNQSILFMNMAYMITKTVVDSTLYLDASKIEAVKRSNKKKVLNLALYILVPVVIVNSFINVQVIIIEIIIMSGIFLNFKMFYESPLFNFFHASITVILITLEICSLWKLSYLPHLIAEAFKVLNGSQLDFDFKSYYYKIFTEHNVKVNQTKFKNTRKMMHSMRYVIIVLGVCFIVFILLLVVVKLIFAKCKKKQNQKLPLMIGGKIICYEAKKNDPEEQCIHY